MLPVSKRSFVADLTRVCRRQGVAADALASPLGIPNGLRILEARE